MFKLISPFKRCLRCNGLLESVDKQSIIEQVPEKVRCLRRQATQVDQFQRCQDCVVYRRRHRIYWKGSHYERLQQFIDGVLDSRTGE